MDTQVIQRPDWWDIGLPLPHLTASVRYSGSGKIRSGGKVVETVTPVRWETLSEWRARKAKADA